MASPRLVGGALVVLALAVAGCDTGDGRTLRSPPPGATAPPLATSSTSSSVPAVIGPPVGSEEASALALTSPVVLGGQAIPARYTCDGEHVSPPLAWTGVPGGTVELALTVRDPDAADGDFVHWVVTGLDPALTGIGEGAVPEGAVEARNDTSEFGWFGPCPPPGETHRYVFTLFALSAPSGVGTTAGATEAIAALESTPGLTATLIASYERPTA